MLDGCVLLGNRVIVPVAGRKDVTELWHDGHPGITKNGLRDHGVGFMLII